METPPTLELTVDLGLWQNGAEVTVEVPASVTVGHLADQLALFVGLPTHDEEETRVPYTLRPRSPAADDDRNKTGQETGRETGDETGHEPDDAIEPDVDRAVAELVGEVRRIRGREQSMIDRELTVIGAGIAGPVELATPVPVVDQLLTTYERKIRDAIDTEVELWLEKGRTLVVGALSDAMNEIRDDLRERIAPMIPSGFRGVVAQYKAGRALRKFGRVRAEVAYTDAVRSGLRLAGRSAGPILGFTGNAAASAASGGLVGGLAGTATGAAAGAVAAAMIILIGVNAGWFGADGDMGPAGQDGRNGQNGTDGDDGADGADGAAGESGTIWSVGLAAPTDGTPGEFHVNRCTGVISHHEEDDWVEIIDLAATQGRAVAGACDNLEIVTPGQSLWTVVSRRCRDDSGGRLTNQEIVRAVAQTWVANLDIVGPTADSIDTSQPLVLRCS